MLWYFTYGSNLDHERFRGRVGDWHEHRQAVLENYCLRFSGEVSSEGGGGAIIEPCAGDRVYGGIYRISAEQIAAMDAVELGGNMDPDQRGKRRTVTVRCDADELAAEVYFLPAPSVYRAPSAAYLRHITDGLRDFGYGHDVIAMVESRAASEPDD